MSKEGKDIDQKQKEKASFYIENVTNSTIIVESQDVTLVKDTKSGRDTIVSSPKGSTSTPIPSNVAITDPPSDAKVGKEVIVKGTSSFPSGHYLWVLARRTDFKPLWWPQREAEVDPKTHEWSTTAVLGVPQDIGWDFDIGAITVDAKGHALLRDYWIKATRTGDWRPIEIPLPSSPPRIVKVK